MRRTRKNKIQVKFSEEINIDNLNLERGEIERLFNLQSLDDGSLKIYPTHVLSSESDTLSLYFNLVNAKIPEKSGETCFKLVASETAFKPLNIQTKYCLKSNE